MTEMSTIIDYQGLFEELAESGLSEWLEVLPAQVGEALDATRHSQLPAWGKVIDRLPVHRRLSFDLSTSAIRIGKAEDLSEVERDQLREHLQAFHPWRKGPFEVFGISIDTEWRSDWKWDRLARFIQPLEGRLVLDIGCGNGYHCWRMRGAGARLVVGIDPVHLYVMQYGAIARLVGAQPVYVLPLKVEDLPATLSGFDTVFSMGVLYHRRSPIDHLLQIKNVLRDGGELVLETLVVEGEEGYALVPDGRYAKMRNVWFIPSPATLMQWLKRSGFRDIEWIDETPTTHDEQRSTDWMRFESLSDFLDPDDVSRTVEGYPAPRRGIVLART